MLAFVLALLSSGTAAEDPAPASTIRGEVEVVNYDDDGEPSQVAIYDAEWGAVLVLKSEKGTELLTRAGATVSATGQIRELELDDDSGFTYGIEINSYTVDTPTDG